MQNSAELRGPRSLSGRDDPASSTYQIEDGVLIDTGGDWNPYSRHTREKFDNAGCTPELRIGPTPAGYRLPDTTMYVRHTQPRKDHR